MTKKLFGEYLIEQGLITAENLLAALIEQQSSLPSISEVAYRRKIYSTDEFLRIIKHQILNKSEFKFACKELHLWTQEIEQMIEAEMMQIQVPIGQILVKKGNIQLDDLLEAIDEFLTESVQKSASENPSLPSETSKSALELKNPEEGPKSEVLLEPQKDNQSAYINPYLKLLNQNRYKDLQFILSLIQEEMTNLKDLNKVRNRIKSLLYETHCIQGACRFVEAQKSLNLVSTGEKLLNKIALDLEKINKEGLQKRLLSIQTMVDVLWELRFSIESSGNESSFFNQEQKSQAYLQNLQVLDQYLNEMRV